MSSDDVLQERARQLARPPDEVRTRTTTALLRFRRGEEVYAIGLDEAHQVVSLNGAARLPDDAWPCIAVGLVRGDLVPVVEPSQGRRRGRQLPQRGVAVEADGMVLILPADEIHGISHVPDVQLGHLGREVAPGAPLVREVTNQGDGLLDVRALVELMRDQRPSEAEPPNERTEG